MGGREGSGRVVVLVDLDCFYCQVEHKRHGIPRDKPLAVRQWDALIAVNYVARARGVSKMTSVQAALEVCPDITMVHVDTLSADSVAPDTSKPVHETRYDSKALLEAYRIESAKIMALLQRIVGEGSMERASIDEAYLDITHMVLSSTDTGNEPTWIGKIVQSTGDALLDDEFPIVTADDLLLARAAAVVQSIRQSVFRELEYTCSAGIAHNKLLAKLVSSFNKPDGQTSCPSAAVPHLLSRVDFRKLRGFGGKLGKRVVALLAGKQQWKIGTDVPEKIPPSQVLELLSSEDLAAEFDAETTEYIQSRCRGEDDSELVAKDKVKSLIAAKSFPQALTRLSDVERWLRVLSTELVSRVHSQRESLHLSPTLLTLSLPIGTRCMPLTARQAINVDELVRIGLSLFEKGGGMRAHEEKGIYRLQISAAKFEELPRSDGIGLYFKQSPVHADHAEQHLSPVVQQGQADAVCDASEESAEFRTSSEAALADDEEEPRETPTEEDSDVQCVRCGASMKQSSLREHHDQHFAEDLQEIETDLAARRRKRPLEITPKRNSSSSTRKVKSSPASMSIKNFFQ